MSHINRRKSNERGRLLPRVKSSPTLAKSPLDTVKLLMRQEEQRKSWLSTVNTHEHGQSVLTRKGRRKARKGPVYSKSERLIAPPIYYINSENEIATLKVKASRPEVKPSTLEPHIPTVHLSGPARAFSVDNLIKERLCIANLQEKMTKKGEESYDATVTPNPSTLSTLGGVVPHADSGSRSKIGLSSDITQGEALLKRFEQNTKQKLIVNKKGATISHIDFYPTTLHHVYDKDFIAENAKASTLAKARLENREKRLAQRAHKRALQLKKVEAKQAEFDRKFIAAREEALLLCDPVKLAAYQKQQRLQRKKEFVQRTWLTNVHFAARLQIFASKAQHEVTARTRLMAAARIVHYIRAYRRKRAMKLRLACEATLNTFISAHVQVAQANVQQDRDDKIQKILIEFCQNYKILKSEKFRNAMFKARKSVINIQRAYRSYRLAKKWRWMNLQLNLELVREARLYENVTILYKVWQTARVKHMLGMKKAKRATGGGGNHNNRNSSFQVKSESIRASQRGAHRSEETFTVNRINDMEASFMRKLTALDRDGGEHLAQAEIIMLAKNSGTRKGHKAFLNIPQELRPLNDYHDMKIRNEIETRLLLQLQYAHMKKHCSKVDAWRRKLEQTRIAKTAQVEQANVELARRVAKHIAGFPDVALSVDDVKHGKWLLDRRNDHLREQHTAEIVDKQLASLYALKPFLRVTYDASILESILDQTKGLIGKTLRQRAQQQLQQQAQQQREVDMTAALTSQEKTNARRAGLTTRESIRRPRK